MSNNNYSINCWAISSLSQLVFNPIKIRSTHSTVKFPKIRLHSCFSVLVVKLVQQYEFSTFMDKRIACILKRCTNRPLDSYRRYIFRLILCKYFNLIFRSCIYYANSSCHDPLFRSITILMITWTYMHCKASVFKALKPCWIVNCCGIFGECFVNI